MSQPTWQPPQNAGQMPPSGWQQPMQQGWGPPPNNDARRMMEYDARKKGAGIAYVLWFFLGGFGAHRFYLERTGSGIAMLIITIVSFLLLAAGIGVLGLLAVGIWAIVDAFLIPGIVRDYNMKVMRSIQ